MWKWEAEQQPKAVIVILHSVYEQHRWYAWLIEKYRSAGFHVVMGDLPGMGSKQNLLEIMMKISMDTINIQNYYLK